MSLVSVASLIARKFLILVLVTALVVGWSAAAEAQTSFDDQYGDPLSSGQEAIESSGDVSDPGSVAAAGVLPDTGGPMLPFFALGALALGSTGLLMLRHNSRR